MIKIKKLDLEKKSKYIIQSVLIAIIIYVFTEDLIHLSVIAKVMISLAVVFSGALITHYPGVTKDNFLISVIMPIGVLLGAVLSLDLYPNLGTLFKLLVIAFFAGMYYLVSLADNIFLVVHDRDEIIPLYRVAVTWSQILQVIVAIPLFAGIFKINSISSIQALIVSAVSFLFAYYQLWIYRFEPDAKKVSVGERFYLCFITSFIVFVASFSVSLFPSEDFLRALFASSVLLFVLNYVSAHLKNEISRKMIIRHLSINVVFLLLVLFFRP